MPARLRIALLFALLVWTILVIVGSAVYYISYIGRLDAVKTRLTLRVNNIASFFKQEENASGQWIQRIDNMTAAPVRDKEVQVFDDGNRRIYEYNDRPADAFLMIDSLLLDKVREEGTLFFDQGKKDAMALYDPETDIVIVSATTDEPGKNQLFQLRVMLWISLAIGACIALLGGYFFAGRLLKPVRKIADKVNDISAKNLTQRIPRGPAQDEWHYLTDTLNRLLDRLQESLDMHRKFISNASHELSTPLTSISNQLSVILQQDRQAEEYKSVITAVYKDALHLSKLTQVLLEFAKASGEESGLEIQPVRVDEVLLELPSELARIDRRYRVLLEFEDLPENEERVLIFGNEKLLLTAIKNIVLNACKYAPDHAAFVRLTIRDGNIRIDVIDNGSGIPKEELENIFQPFYRGSIAGSLPGFGLGLSLAQRIIKLHKGYIEVSSESRTGTTFTIFLPAGTMYLKE